MASIRRFKKELAYVTSELISNCELAIIFQGTKAFEELSQVITKAIDQHNNFHDAAVKAPKEGKKQFFAKLNKDIEESTEKLYDEISEICSKHKEA